MYTANIASNSPSDNPNVETPKLEHDDFASGIAASAFGRNYPHPDSHDFIDRPPHWPGAAR